MDSGSIVRSQCIQALLMTGVQSGFLHIFVEGLLQGLIADWCPPMQEICTHLTATHPRRAALHHVEILESCLLIQDLPCALRVIFVFMPGIGSEAIVV